MALSETARRMIDTLPVYYWGNPLVERFIQAWANRIDELDAYIDAIERGLNPALADDRYGFLAVWEDILGLPVAPADATVGQRLDGVSATLQQLGSVASRDTLALIGKALGGSFTFTRNDGTQLLDTIEVAYAEDSFLAGRLRRLLARAYPAHREVAWRYGEGFLLDESPLDDAEL